MNVSFTRARSKLIIFGSRKTLQAAPLLEEFFALMDSQGWILRLPKDADKMHNNVGQSPRKRSVGDVSDVKRTPKRARFSAFSEDGLLKGRPILQDLVNEDR